MRKLAFLAALFAALGVTAVASASDPIYVEQTGQEGCVSVPDDTCTYTATRAGGYAASGPGWTLTVEIPALGDTRDTNLDGKLRYEFTDTNAPPQGCGLWNPGATVTTQAPSDQGIAAGNPFPSATDEPVGDGNDCDGGRIAVDNPDYTPID